MLLSVTLCACSPLTAGRAPVGADPDANAVVGGTVVTGPEYNFQAAVFDEVGVLCSAVVLDDSWVLTTRGCTPSSTFEGIRVGVGSRQVDQMTTLPVDDRFSVPDVGIELLHVATGGLLEHASRATLVDEAMFAELAMPGTVASVAGWGHDISGTSTANDLVRAEVPILNEAMCDEQVLARLSRYADEQVVEHQLFCAGVIGYDAPDACDDVGSPLTIDVDGQPLVVGVTWSSACGDPRLTSTYVEVSQFIEEIAHLVPSVQVRSVDTTPDAPDGCTIDDVFEPNDSEGAAASLSPGRSVGLVATGEDDDWYRLPTVQPGETALADLWFSHLDGDLDLVMTLDGAVLEGSYSTTDNEFLEWTNDTGVAVQPLLQVQWYGASTCGMVGYELSVDVDEF